MNVEEIRQREFPWTLERNAVIYLNHASTGPTPASAMAAMRDMNALRAEPWRITLEHQFGVLQQTRELVAQLINATPGEIAVMTNTSHGINLAARALPLAPEDVILSLDREFPANVYPWMAAARARGATFRQVACRDRVPEEHEILAALSDERVRILALSWVAFESGAKLDLARLGRACRERGIYFVVDAIQGLGADTLDVQAVPVDVLSCGAQKWLLGPWGAGFAYVRQELVAQLEPQEVGWMAPRGTDDFAKMLDYDMTWRDDARRFEVVTLPYQDFAGMNAALALLLEAGPAAVARRVAAHADRIVRWAQATSGVRLITPAQPERRAGIVSFVPPHPAQVSERLTQAQVCHSLREGAIRFSPHFYQTDAEIDRALELVESFAGTPA